jgi:MHS family proline/betaine transporter-like MFS transporter
MADTAAKLDAGGGTPRRRKRLSFEALAAGTVGNVLEWYDFGLYGYFAPVIGSLFFPSSNPIASLIGSYAGFAVGFVVRPIGGVVLGHLGDRIGRKAVLVISVVLMGSATTALGLLPTYHQIGMWAPVLLLVVRVFQGFSVGGEFTGSVSYLVETAPHHRRGLAGSFANVGSTTGFLLAAGLAALTTNFSSHAELYSWSWRVPFVMGGLFSVLAYFVRSRLRDSGYEPQESSAQDDMPLLQAFKRGPRAMVLAMLFTWGYGVADYLTMVFLPIYATEFGSVRSEVALSITTAAQGVGLAAILMAGWATDHRIRRRTLLIISFSLVLLTAVVLFHLGRLGGSGAFWLAQIPFGIMLGMIMGVAPAMLAEMFRSEYRVSGYSLAFNIGIGIGGGTAPLIATGLIGLTGYTISPAAYLMFGAALALAALYLMKDRSREPLL